jgi:hypothetical protein
MRLKLSLRSTILALGMFFASSAHGQSPATQPPSAAQQALAQAAGQGRYAYIVFYRADDEASRAMAQTVQAAAAQRPDAVATVFVSLADPVEGALVQQFAVARAPMPLTIVTAPNGAITGAFPQRVTAEQLTGAFVTPAMAACMKSMQQGRLVFLCLQTTPQPVTPVAINEFAADPHYKNRVDVVLVQATDPAEAQLLAELQLNAAQAAQANTVFFAPPGVLVGKFGMLSTKAEIAGALHKAGKCCDDPHCKHGHAAQPAAGTVR